MNETAQDIWEEHQVELRSYLIDLKYEVHTNMIPESELQLHMMLEMTAMGMDEVSANDYAQQLVDGLL